MGVRLGGRGGQSLAEGLVAEHLRQLGEYLQMQIGGALRHQQDEDEADRLAVGRVEGNRFAHAHEGADRLLDALDAAVRDGHTLAKAGGAEFFACKQAVEDQAARDVVVVLEKQAGAFENALLAADIKVQQHIGCRQ